MKHVLILIGAIVVIGVGYYALSPLFVTIIVDDPIPETAIEDTVLPSGSESLSPEERATFEKEMESANATDTEMMNEPMPTDDSADITYPVMGTIGHPASGNVRVVETNDNTIIRYENFETINGPRLHVYLAKTLDADDFIDLGPIKGTKGNINYTVPDGVSLADYPYVMYWCVPFGVLFNYAELR